VDKNPDLLDLSEEQTHSFHEAEPMSIHGLTFGRRLVIGLLAFVAVGSLAALIACLLLDAANVHWFSEVTIKTYTDAALEPGPTHWTIIEWNFWIEVASLATLAVTGPLAVYKTVRQPTIRETSVRISTLRHDPALGKPQAR
jgi:hypothetical protein